MNLLIISGDVSIAQGQAGVFYYMLQQFSKYWDKIDIIVPKAKGARRVSIHKNVTVYPSNISKIFQPYYIYKKGMEIWQRQRFDLITIHSYPPFYNDIGGWLLQRRLKVPCIFEVMHIVGYPRAVDISERLKRICSRIYYRFIWRMPQAIRVINYKEVPNFLVSCGVPQSKILYLPCFYTDFSIFRPLNLQKTGRKIIFSGRLVKNKGIFKLLEAFKRVVLEMNDAKLIILGDGILKNKIIQYIRVSGLNESVIFRTAVSYTEVGKIYNECDTLVVPSYNDGGPRVAIEAMACGIAVITTRVGAMNEIIKNGENGLFITWDPKDIADKILYLLRNDNIRKKIAKAAESSVQRFEYNNLIRDYALSYQNIIRSARNRSGNHE